MAVTESYSSNLTLFVLQVGKQAQLHNVTDCGSFKDLLPNLVIEFGLIDPKWLELEEITEATQSNPTL